MLGLLTLLSLLSNWPALRCGRFCSQPNAEIYNIDITEQHPKTIETALKHCETYGRYAAKSICAIHTSVAFAEAAEFVDRFYQLRKNKVNDQKFVILDSGCGKGMSTVCLASLYPDIPVIGIDRSITRLSSNKKIEIRSNRNPTDSNKREPSESGNLESVFLNMNAEAAVVNLSLSQESIYLNNNDEDDVIGQDEEDEGEEKDNAGEISSIQLKDNAILLRAELSDFFSLVAYQSDWIVHSHYLLYPNPYPKSKHLKRRWHGHPIFPVMLAIGGNFIVRSNWRVYCEELQTSVRAISESSVLPGLTTVPHFRTISNKGNVQVDGNPVTEKVTTHFERKYLQVGLDVYESQTDLGFRNREDRCLMLNSIVVK